MGLQKPLLVPERAPRRWQHVALAGCAVAVITACAGLLPSSATPTSLLATVHCSNNGCAAVESVATRTRMSQLQMHKYTTTDHESRGRSMPDLGVLGRAAGTSTNTFGSLAAVGKIGQSTTTPKLKSFNVGRVFTGSGTGPKWENGRTAVIGHHRGDPKVMESATDKIDRRERIQHEHYYYDKAHDDNGRAYTGNNADAPEWWPKGRNHQRRPYVVWGSRYAGEPWADEHKDDTALIKAGVNVEGHRDIYRGLPLPWYDNTQWDHDMQ